MTLGDLSYSTTLLPGEKVRLFTSDRRSRFSFDSATRVARSVDFPAPDMPVMRMRGISQA